MALWGGTKDGGRGARARHRFATKGTTWHSEGAPKTAGAGHVPGIVSPQKELGGNASPPRFPRRCSVTSKRAPSLPRGRLPHQLVLGLQPQVGVGPAIRRPPDTGTHRVATTLLPLQLHAAGPCSVESGAKLGGNQPFQGCLGTQLRESEEQSRRQKMEKLANGEGTEGGIHRGDYFFCHIGM